MLRCGTVIPSLAAPSSSASAASASASAAGEYNDCDALTTRMQQQKENGFSVGKSIPTLKQENASGKALVKTNKAIQGQHCRRCFLLCRKHSGNATFF